MAELKSYVCPNCGANTTNAQNCDYCGSLLVRFVERNIDLSGTSYLNNDKVIPGLIKHLEQNLLGQKTEHAVITDIYFKNERGEYGSIFVLPQRCASWDGNTPVNIGGSEDGLLIVVGFLECLNSGYDNFNKNQKLMEQKFKQLQCSHLFTPHIGFYTEEGGAKIKSSQYAINFGHDPEGAARIISEFFAKVYGISSDDPSIEIFTNAGTEEIINSRSECSRLFYGVDNSEETDDRSNYSEAYDEEDEDSTFSIFGIPWYWLLAAISAFISIISQCS